VHHCAHTVTSEDFKHVHRLGALANDALDVFTDRQAVRDSNAQYTDWRNTLNVRNCGGLTNLKFATAVSEDYLNAFGLIYSVSFRQSTNQSPSHSPHFTHGSSCTSSSFLPSLTPLFNSQLKTYLFHKSFPPYTSATLPLDCLLRLKTAFWTY